ncbi:MAG: LacI family DNA-binding transcriptional regulator [Deinococcus sp.]|nr:LacI family DNA-binding transcriptional regulator [Deinococcus sp.]
MRRITIEHVARLSGVSKGTVSRVLNNHPSVSPQTRTRVQEAIAQLGFQPSSAARGLARGQRHTIGVAVPNVTVAGLPSPYKTALLEAISNAAADAGYTVQVSAARAEEAGEKSNLEWVLDRQVDGVILLDLKEHDQRLAVLRHRQVPFVAVGTSPVGSWVEVENEEGARLAILHLLDLGHQRIGHIAGPKGLDVTGRRLVGYRRALEERALGFEKALVQGAEFTELGGYRTGTALLEQGVTAIFAASDQMALGAIEAARDAGLSVPGDLSVVGFDDVLPARLANLTTVHQPIASVGRAATELLIALLHGGKEQHLIFPTELVVRSTTAPPNGRARRR